MRAEIDLKDLLGSLTKTEKISVLKALASQYSNQPVSIMKKFVADYEEDYQVDHIIANICADVISKVGNSITSAIKETKGKGLCGTIAGKLAVEQIRIIANNIEKAIGEVEKEGHDCGSCND
jgi:hypothetical protein